MWARGVRPARELTAGSLVAGRFRLDAKLGEGGMGTVWSATETTSEVRYALKFLKGAATADADSRRRFQREARAASLVIHPNVVRTHDVFEMDGGTPVMVMDLLEGGTLGKLLREKHQLSLARTAEILVPAISAVGTAHALGVVHRDLKPDNVFLTPSGSGPEHVRVLDFGIAKLMRPDAGITGGGALTHGGALLGTPWYMSPEQAMADEHVDHRTDIWSLGVILYEALAGARPVEGESRARVIERLLSSAIAPIETLVFDLPVDIATLIGRMLSRQRGDRPQDLREVLTTLRPHASGDIPDFGPPMLTGNA